MTLPVRPSVCPVDRQQQYTAERSADIRYRSIARDSVQQQMWAVLRRQPKDEAEHRHLRISLNDVLWDRGWLGSRVVSVLDSGAKGRGFKSQSRRCNSIRQTAHTHCASVHQAAKLVAAFLRVAGVTAGLAESNGSLPPGL